MAGSRRVVAITGAASGMGAACVQRFASAGDAVELIDLSASVADLAEEVQGTANVGDVSDSQFCNAVIDEIIARNGRIDVLVNAAGTIHRADALGTDDAAFDRVMKVNVFGTFAMSRAAVSPMVDQGRGAIVNFGSIWGDVGATGVVAYCASKGAVHQLTRAMALDHVEAGIRINAVAPGEVRTQMLSSHRETPPTDEELQALADATIPMKRLAEPDEIAGVVMFLASEEASYMTGEVVQVDGGYTAR